MADKSLEYFQTYHGVLSVTGGIKRWSEGGPPILYETQAKAAKDCADKEFVVAVKLTWKQPRPTP